jgi:hypothetical protein
MSFDQRVELDFWASVKPDFDGCITNSPSAAFVDR